MAKTIGGDGEYARRSTVNVTIVPVASARPSKENLCSDPRSAAGADTRAGSGRFGGSGVSMPRHDRNRV